MTMSATLGRIRLDEYGIHAGKALKLFGRTWSIPLEQIHAWATVDEIMTSRQHRQGVVLARVIELHHPGGVEVVRWGRDPAAFTAFVAELERMLPGRRTESRADVSRSNDDIPL